MTRDEFFEKRRQWIIDRETWRQEGYPVEKLILPGRKSIVWRWKDDFTPTVYDTEKACIAGINSFIDFCIDFENYGCQQG